MANRFSNTPFAGEFGDEILFPTADGISGTRADFRVVFALNPGRSDANFFSADRALNLGRRFDSRATSPSLQADVSAFWVRKSDLHVGNRLTTLDPP
jgi:hypothetical protein